MLSPNRTLTHCGPVTPFGDLALGQLWCSNGELPYGTKPLPGLALCYFQSCSVAFAHSRLLPICDAFFIQRGHRRSLPIIGEGSDDGHRIKRALYIGIKRLWFEAVCPNFSSSMTHFHQSFLLWHRGSTCLGVPNVPFGTSGCAERVCLHRDGCARMRSAYPECPDPNLSAYPGQDGGCRR